RHRTSTRELMSDGYIGQAVDSLLDAVGDLDEISIGNVETLIDAAIAKVLAASSTRMSKYVAMLQQLKPMRAPSVPESARLRTRSKNWPCASITTSIEKRDLMKRTLAYIDALSPHVQADATEAHKFTDGEV